MIRFGRFVVVVIFFRLIASLAILEFNEIESDFDFLDSSENSFNAVDDVAKNIQKPSDTTVTMYAGQSIGKSHRYYFIAGERKDGDRLLDNVAKQTGWHFLTNTTLNLSYPTGREIEFKLNYVFLTVYQESNFNRIRIIDGGIGQNKIDIMIEANQTRYLQYNATFYGI